MERSAEQFVRLCVCYKHLSVRHTFFGGPAIVTCGQIWTGGTNINPWSTVVLEKLMLCHLVKNFAAFYGTRKFITTFTTAYPLSLSWARWIHSTPHRPICRRPFLVLLSYLGLSFSSGLLPSDFPAQTLYAPLPSLPSQVRSFLFLFVTSYMCTLNSCWLLTKPPSWRATPCRLSATCYSLSSQLPSVSPG